MGTLVAGSSRLSFREVSSPPFNVRRTDAQSTRFSALGLEYAGYFAFDIVSPSEHDYYSNIYESWGYFIDTLALLEPLLTEAGSHTGLGEHESRE